jgi:PAS domain S-box-containing protein
MSTTTSSDPFACLFRSSRDAMAIVDRTGAITSLNPAAERLFGTMERDAVGLSIFRFCLDQDEPFLRMRIFAALAGVDLKPEPATRLGADGGVRYLDQTVFALVAPDGERIAVACLWRPLEEAAAAALRRSAGGELAPSLGSSPPEGWPILPLRALEDIEITRALDAAGQNRARAAAALGVSLSTLKRRLSARRAAARERALAAARALRMRSA